ncbi:MAG: hypothetical protein HQK58_02565 [Deltaproteobacteria bacterium]|nr:hypothetical protein [Deltaproteobacteria bacterium]
MNDSKVIKKLLDGSSLRICINSGQSPSVSSLECYKSYDLPHVVINGTHFWGKTRNNCFEVYPKSAEYSGLEPHITSYCFTNMGDISCRFEVATVGSNFSNDQFQATFMKTGGDNRHLWRVIDDYQLLWDSRRNDSPKVITDAIQHASRVKIVMLDSKGAWNIHPVDLPMYFPSLNQFELKTCYDCYPFFMQSPGETKKIIEHTAGCWDSGPDKETESVGVMATVKGFHSFYHIYSNGKVSTIYDLIENKSQKYNRLKVFTKKAAY